jgi:16S rRNA (cytosine967-C5)-methyltransferase
MNPRKIAYRILLRLERGSGNSAVLLQEELAQVSDPRDRHLVTELVLGTLRRRAHILFLIETLSNRPMRQVEERVLVILQLGVYQLVYTRIPQHAVIHETAGLCNGVRLHSAVSFVNGVLRGLQAKLGRLPEPVGTAANRLAVTGSHPQWMVERWLKRFGEEETGRLLEVNNAPSKVYVRVNELSASCGAAVERLEQAGVRLTATPFGPGLLAVEEGAPQLAAGFMNGEFYIHDAGIEVLGREMAPQPGDKVLEIAAAPGGKTFQLALRMNDTGMIVALDSDPQRMALWWSNMRRLRIRSAHGVVGDALRVPLRGLFDRVIVDAPCSSIGVARRHPEVKWWRRPEHLPQLQQTQLQILDACATYVGGDLFYIVCSFEEEETRIVSERFLASHPEFRQDRELYLLPHRDGTDGFYMSVFRRS